MNAAILLYATMVVAVGFQEEFAPLAGALAAHYGHGEIWLVALACAVGSWLHGAGLYVVGHRGKAALRGERFRRPLDLVRRHPVRALLASRFAYGLRLTLPIACGAAGVPFGPFALWTGVSSVVWAAVYCAIGWWAGELAVRTLRDLKQFELPVGAALLAAGVVFYLWRRGRAQVLQVP